MKLTEFLCNIRHELNSIQNLELIATQNSSVRFHELIWFDVNFELDETKCQKLKS